MPELEELNWSKSTEKQEANLVPNIFLSSNVVGGFVFNIE